MGVLTGAVGAGIARGLGVRHEWILVAVAVLIALTGLSAMTDDARLPVDDPTPGLRLARGLMLVGFVGAAAFIVEGGMESWSALFLERQLDAGPTLAGFGPGVFGAAMASGRFLGQALGRFSDRVLLGGGALLAGLGCTLAALAPSPAFGLLGFAIGGIGVSLNAPIVFGFAARRPDAGTAVATVTTIGYLGLLVGPPLVGIVAQLTSLRVSFVVLAVIAAAVTGAATRLRFDAG
jgi:MFS family permease